MSLSTALFNVPVDIFFFYRYCHVGHIHTSRLARSQDDKEQNLNLNWNSCPIWDCESSALPSSFVFLLEALTKKCVQTEWMSNGQASERQSSWTDRLRLSLSIFQTISLINCLRFLICRCRDAGEHFKKEKIIFTISIFRQFYCNDD